MANIVQIKYRIENREQQTDIIKIEYSKQRIGDRDNRDQRIEHREYRAEDREERIEIR